MPTPEGLEARKAALRILDAVLRRGWPVRIDCISGCEERITAQASDRAPEAFTEMALEIEGGLRDRG